MLQKREFKRFGIKGDINIATKDNGGRILRAYLEDMGMGGFRMSSAEKIEQDQNVRFSLYTGLSDRPLIGEGRIRHISSSRIEKEEPFSAGVQFTQVNKDTIKNLIYKVATGKPKTKFLTRQQKEDIFLILKFLPLFLLLTWFALKTSHQYYYYNIKEQSYLNRLREGVLHYLNKTEKGRGYTF